MTASSSKANSPRYFVPARRGAPRDRHRSARPAGGRARSPWPRRQRAGRPPPPRPAPQVRRAQRERRARAPPRGEARPQHPPPLTPRDAPAEPPGHSAPGSGRTSASRVVADAGQVPLLDDVGARLAPARRVGEALERGAVIRAVRGPSRALASVSGASSRRREPTMRGAGAGRSRSGSSRPSCAVEPGARGVGLREVPLARTPRARPTAGRWSRRRSTRGGPRGRCRGARESRPRPPAAPGVSRSRSRPASTSTPRRRSSS